MSERYLSVQQTSIQILPGSKNFSHVATVWSVVASHLLWTGRRCGFGFSVGCYRTDYVCGGSASLAATPQTYLTNHPVGAGRRRSVGICSQRSRLLGLLKKMRSSPGSQILVLQSMTNKPNEPTSFKDSHCLELSHLTPFSVHLQTAITMLRCSPNPLSVHHLVKP